MQQWWLFFSIALVTTFSPGPAVLFAVSNALGMGARTAVFGSLGNVLGLSLLSLLAFVGLGVVLATSPLAFLTLKIAGAGYLVYLALQQWQQSRQIKNLQAGAPQKRRQIFRQGFVVAITNPKAILFFSALFPQFIQPDQAAWPQFSLLTATFILCSLISHGSYLLLAHKLQPYLQQPKPARWLNRISALLLLLIGVSLLWTESGRW